MIITFTKIFNSQANNCVFFKKKKHEIFRKGAANKIKYPVDAWRMKKVLSESSIVVNGL
jgi:hypothetical protein